MTRKDYEKLSQMIRNRLSVIRKMDTTDSDWYRGAFDGLLMLARDYADDFERDHPRFDRQRFLDACGLLDADNQAKIS